ncbi:hypothetical protein BHE74_00024360 [Ensete ventricosum]|nr:hypothetical protein BHE74_00024360 [Ensete ventricosum]
MSTERLNQSTDRIKEGRRTMLETEELGVSILQDLHQQRQSLLHAHSTVCFCANDLVLVITSLVFIYELIYHISFINRLMLIYVKLTVQTNLTVNHKIRECKKKIWFLFSS